MNHQTRQKASEFDTKLANTLESSYEEHPGHPEHPKRIKSKPYITTITVCVYLSAVFPFIDKLTETYNSSSGLCIDFINSVLGGKECFFPSRKTFMNSVIFTLKDDNNPHSKKVAIKCFKNGSLHITGVRSIERAITIAQVMCAFYELMHELHSPATQASQASQDSTYTIKNFDVQLVNTHFTVDVGNGHLRLQNILNVCLKESQHLCMYNNERHAGVIIKYLTESMRNLSIIVFESGNVLICAFCDCDEYLEAWRYITRFLDSHWDEIWQENGGPSEPRAKANARKGKTCGGFDYGKYIVL